MQIKKPLQGKDMPCRGRFPAAVPPLFEKGDSLFISFGYGKTQVFRYPIPVTRERRTVLLNGPPVFRQSLVRPFSTDPRTGIPPPPALCNASAALTLLTHRFLQYSFLKNMKIRVKTIVPHPVKDGGPAVPPLLAENSSLWRYQAQRAR